MYPHNTIRRKERIVLVLVKRGWAETVVVVSKKRRGGGLGSLTFFLLDRLALGDGRRGGGRPPARKKHESKIAFLHLISPEF